MESPKPVRKTVRTFYPWDKLTEVGMSFVIDEPKCVRQLVFAANRKEQKRESGVRYGHATVDGVVTVTRLA